MGNLTIDANDAELEYRNEGNLLVDVYYKGELFTGVMEDQHERIAYRNGLAHGEGVAYYNSGKIYAISYYENGVDLKSTTFFESGQVNKEDSFDPTTGNYSNKAWNLAGNLVRDNHTVYYNDGKIKQVREVQDTGDFIRRRYSKSGECMYEVIDSRPNSPVKRETSYHEKVMWANYHDSLVEENPELANSDDKNETFFIWMWFWKIFDEDEKKYLELVADLLKHPEKEVRRTIANIIALHKLNKYLSKEILEDPESGSLLEELTAYHDARDPDREAKTLVIKA